VVSNSATPVAPTAETAKAFIGGSSSGSTTNDDNNTGNNDSCVA
jgi:hypothetical protein